jgi:RHS repeat-associated protein
VRRLIELFLLCIVLFAVGYQLSAQDEDFFAFTVGKEEDRSLAPPPTTFIPKEYAICNPQLPKVNVITGEYCEEECDLIVAGTEPLSYRRFYDHLGHKDTVYGHWRINPECFMLLNFELSRFCHRDYQKLAGCGREDGSIILYERGVDNAYVFDLFKHPNWTHTSESGRKHPLNTNVTFETIRKKDDFCYYRGEVREGDGTIRYFSTNWNIWPRDNGDFGSFPPPPYQAQIVQQRQPNGNLIEYAYSDFNEEKSKVRYYLLRKVTAYNAQKTIVLGTLDIGYTRGGKEANKPVQRIYISGSDGRSTTLIQDLRTVQTKTSKRPKIYDVVLNTASGCWKPNQYYQYRWEAGKTYFKAPFLCEAMQDDGRVLATSYDLGSKKVIAQSAPVGPDNQIVPIARYEYQSDNTIVCDGENNKTIYRFNSDKRIIAVEKYQDRQLYSTERNEWDPQTGNLLKKDLEDAKGYPMIVTTYRYDPRHNIIEERTGDDLILRTFSEDGFNLKLTESDRPGKLVKYAYVPNTNLLTSELVYDHGRLCKRTFHFYDPQIGSARVRTIIDDGNSDNPSDLTSVTYHRILEITPKRTLPCLGLPEQIREKTIDEQGNETLLKKVCYTYHPSGKIVREEHYNASDEYSYSIVNTYDDKERLIATTDPLGNKTTFKYDNNFNLITQSGPRADVYKEWVYDRANRPIEEKEWQTDGTILTTKKKYDKASRVVATIDESGFETRYEHDALGRITVIHHPDGACEKKVYDHLSNLLEEQDANGYITRKEYNFRSQPTAIYRPDGFAEHFAYNNNGGTLSCHTDSEGIKILYAYDIFDRPTRIETYAPNGALLKVTTTTYSTFNKLSETDGEGNTTHYHYDYAGRKILEEKSRKKTFYSYDSLGRLYKTQEGDALYEEAYNPKGELIEEKTKDLDGNLVEQEHYVYDELGNRTHTINSKGTTETYYNIHSLPILKKDPVGHVTQLSYEYKNGFTCIEIDPLRIQTVHRHDSRGNEYETLKNNSQGTTIQKVQRRFDGNKNLTQETHTLYEGTQPFKTITHTWAYGPCNRLEKFCEAGQKETCYVYNRTGKLAQIIKPDQTPISSEYDILSRLAHFFSHDFDYTYIYNKNDNVLSVFDSISGVTTTRSYDSLENITKETLGNGLSLLYAYDIHGRRIRSIFPDGSQVNYLYHTNHLYQITKGGLKYTYTERDLEGNPSKIELPASLGIISIERDPLSRWKTFASPFYASVFHQESYDPVGNLCHYQYSDALGTNTCSYTYNDLRQLTSEEEHQYAYDSLHNRLIKDDLSYVINDLCAITHDGHTTYEYDPNGNLLFDGTTRFAYDSLDRLIATQQGTSKTVYTYDAFNRRLSKTRFENDTKLKRELYFYDGDNEIGSTDENGHIKELRLLGEGLGGEIGASILLELQGKTYIPLHDHRGCIVTLVNLATKKSTETYRYTAYGEQLTTGELSPWRFSSKRVDPETGLIYFGRRYYSPSLGRWTTPDPQGLQDGPNLYAYLHNCPLNDFDLYGLWSWMSMWEGTKSFGLGASGYLYDMGCGMGHGLGKMGQWMHADFQYEYFNDRSFFHTKSLTATEGWKSLGKAVWKDPIGTCVPGIMEAWRNPTSPAAWGKAAVDAALIGFSAAKFCGPIANIGGAATKGVIDRVAKVPTKMARIGAKEMHGMENALKVGNFKYTNTAGSHITDLVKKGPFKGELSRPYMKSPHTVNEIMAARKPIPDPGRIPGGLRWDVPGAFRGSEGIWELVLHPESEIIYHFNFK